MKNKAAAFLLLLILIFSLCSCSKSESNFQITFIDVGQGDAALVECDGHRMLIDAGPSNGRDNVYQVLNTITQHNHRGVILDYLVISHLHDDHYGGIAAEPSAIANVGKIGNVWCNKTINSSEYPELTAEINRHYQGSITIPVEGTTISLGSAQVKVLYSRNEHNNDSLVLLITYGETRFMFTGDIEDQTQKTVYKMFSGDNNGRFDINVMKMPHHGAKSTSMYVFLNTFMPEYSVISAADSKHPNGDTISKLEDFYKTQNRAYDERVLCTKESGNITIVSDGKTVTATSSKSQ